MSVDLICTLVMKTQFLCSLFYILMHLYFGFTNCNCNIVCRCSTQETGVSGTDSLTLSLLPSASTTLRLNSPAEEDVETLNCCSDCRNKYEKEALLLREQDEHKQPDSPQSCSSSVETPSKAPTDQGTQSTCASQPVLPLWLQQALPSGSTTAMVSIATSFEVST